MNTVSAAVFLPFLSVGDILQGLSSPIAMGIYLVILLLLVGALTAYIW